MNHITLAALILAAGSLAVAPARAQVVVAPRAITSSSVTVAPRIDWTAWRASGVTSPSQPHNPLPAPAPAAPGLVACAVTENGAGAPAFVEVRSSGRVIASGACGARIEVPAGDYHAMVTLESVLDRPQRTVAVRVPANGTGVVRVDFPVAIVEVRFTKDREPAFGQAILMVGGREVGSIGNGVPARVSAGRVTMIARYRTEVRTYELDLSAGQRRMITAAF
ncbi:MAG: hypothetical protein KF729_08505 [Sandaracinaceae bacterium]|nr:hypothetical protein [Sandaracinaceae bacterium]